MQTDAQIDILITRFLSGEASPDEAMQLENWMDESATNRVYFNSYCKVVAIPGASAIADSKKLAWEKVKAALSKSHSPGSTLISWRMAGIAASIITVITLAFLLKNIFAKENDKTVYQALLSAKIIALKDSTEINLLPNSSITTDKEYNITNRKITLKGSAFFSVKHNEYKPFIIDMATLHIKDLGTMFGIVTTPSGDTVFIRVTESRIFVYDDFGSSDSLRAGENAIYSKPQKKLQVFHIDMAIGNAEKDTEIKHPVIRYNSDLSQSRTDSAIKNNLSPASSQKLDKIYTPGGNPLLTFNDSSAAIRIVDDMHNDGLIKNEESAKTVTFELSNTEFIINGKIQSAAVFLRYKQKYGPPTNADKAWLWCHNLHCPPANK